MGKFKELRVWQKSIELVQSIYEITKKGSFSKDYGLKDQIRRAAVSIPSNIAEGDELNTQKQSIQFFYIAKGSTAEVITQLIIANKVNYISIARLEALETNCEEISNMLGSLIRFRKQNNNK